MFQSILIPISSEFYPPAVFQISAELATLFNSTVTAVYITERKTLEEVERLSGTHLSFFEQQETQDHLRQEYLRQAECIVFQDAKAFFKKRNLELQTKCVEGAFGEVIQQELAHQQYDLIVMGFEKECYIDYRLLDELEVPVWVESGIRNDTLLAVCSNLAPNQKVPTMSQQLATALGKKLHILYVVDLEDPILVDETGKRLERQAKEALRDHGQRFIDEITRKGISAELVIGVLEKEIIRAANRIKPMLVIMGREKKEKGMWGFPVKNVKRKLAEHCRYSFLFVN
ncbi:MAG: universal stress protein [Candidatus Thermoplasmatota archaeon]|nr:universal stress protein [Candidatus Thermoplasmatota archaeon]